MYNTTTKILLGILIGIFLSFCASYLWRTYWLRDFLMTPVTVSKTDTLKETLTASIMQSKLQNAKFEENFQSINKRLDDFLIFGGMIITLLLAITVSVYLKTEAEVSKHFKENLGKYTEDAKKLVEEINKTGESAKQELALIQSSKKAILMTQPP